VTARPTGFLRFRLEVATVVLLLTAAFASARAQNITAEQVPPSDQPRVYRTIDSRIAIGRSVHVAADEEISDAVVVIGGTLRVDGRVRGDAVVVGGTIELGPKSDVRGDVVAVGGGIVREPGSQLRGNVSDVSFGNWDSWAIGGIYLPTFELGDFGRWLSLLGAVFRISLLALLMAVVLLAARAPVARIGRSAAAEPGRAFLLGLAAELLFLPALIVASVGLIITIIGIPLVAVLVPVSFFAAFVALVLGFTAIACRLGEWVEDRVGWRGRSAYLASAIGLILIVAPTVLSRMIGVLPDPLRFTGFGLLIAGVVLEFIIWTIGLGATLMTGFGRWSTAPPPVPPVPQPGIVQMAG
jgi:hypothetical protein